MNDDKYKKLCAFALIAILLTLIVYSMAQTAQITADNNANITNVFEVVVNNTDKAPMLGTGERIANTTYWANNSPVMVFIFCHNPLPADIDIDIEINGTKVQDDDVRTSVNNNNRSKWIIIPKFASYKVDISPSVHHYEWREYPILSGRNGTLSVNVSGTTDHSKLTNLNWSVAGHIIDAEVNFSHNNVTGIYRILDNDSDSYIQWDELSMVIVQNTTSALSTLILNGINKWQIISNSNTSLRTSIEQYTTQILFKQNSIEKMAINASGDITINTTLDMQNHSIININLNNTLSSYSGYFTRDMTLASGTQNITGVPFKPTYAIFNAYHSTTQSVTLNGFDTNGTAHAALICDFTASCSGATTVSVWISPGAGLVQSGIITSMNNNGFTLTFTKTGLPTGTMYVYFTAYR